MKALSITSRSGADHEPFEVGGSGATFSADRRYRYRLWRGWNDPERRVLFIGVNPSTADEHASDPTITKEIGFAKRWGFGALDKVNLCALVSTDVRGLTRASDPVGPENDETIVCAITDATRIVLCWGSKTSPKALAELVARRAAAVAALVRSHARGEVGHLGLCANGAPTHTLMLAYETPFVRLP